MYRRRFHRPMLSGLGVIVSPTDVPPSSTPLKLVSAAQNAAQIAAPYYVANPAAVPNRVDPNFVTTQLTPPPNYVEVGPPTQEGFFSSTKAKVGLAALGIAGVLGLALRKRK